MRFWPMRWQFLSTLPARGATGGGDAEGVVGKVISIHAPREGSDQLKATVQRPCNIFLSTLPARGATARPRIRLTPISLFLSTLPARGATMSTGAAAANGIISIHAPREGSDPFLSTLPIAGSDISIHAPREGSDPRPGQPCKSRSYFYPRSPRGERLVEDGAGPAAPHISIHAPREGSDHSFSPSLSLKA